MKKIYTYQYTYIDVYDFIKSPDEIKQNSRFPDGVLESLPPLEDTKAKLREAGWEGDGEFGIIWLPPFMFLGYSDGIYMWHVKQANNGISWLALHENLVNLLYITSGTEIMVQNDLHGKTL